MVNFCNKVLFECLIYILKNLLWHNIKYTVNMKGAYFFGKNYLRNIIFIVLFLEKYYFKKIQYYFLHWCMLNHFHIYNKSFE